MTCRVLPRLLLALSLLAPASLLPGSIPLAAAADGSAALAQRPGQAAIASAHRLATDAGFEVLECFGVTRAVGSLVELAAYSMQRVTDGIAWMLLKANYPQAHIIAAPAIAIVGRRPVASG